MEGDCGVLIPGVIAVQQGVEIGDILSLSNSNATVDCTIAGIGTGGMLPAPYFGMPAREAFGLDPNPASLTIWPLPGSDFESLEDDLEALAVRNGDNAWLSNPDMELRSVLDVSDQLEGITYGLLSLAIFAAALGMVNTTMMSILQRGPELGVLRRVGGTQKQAKLIIMGEAALTGLIGGGLGLLAGLGMTVINAVSYGGLRFRIQDLDLWASAWTAVKLVFPAGLLGLAFTPILSIGTAWFPARYILRKKLVNILLSGGM